jgi:predicted signal transduction protein with EAL and GGDEF domain
MQERNYTPLAALFLSRFLVLYVAFSLLGPAAMTALEYQRQRARVVDELHALTTTIAPVLGYAVWDFQETAVNAILHGIMQDPDVVASRNLGSPPASRVDYRDAQSIADKIRAGLAEPCVIDGAEHACSASVGLHVIADDAGDAEAVLKMADAAMYEDKKSRRDGAMRESR